MLPASWDNPSDTVHRGRFSARKSSANRNSFQAIMKTYRAFETTAGIASGRLIRRRIVQRDAPSMAAACSSDTGTVSK